MSSSSHPLLVRLDPRIFFPALRHLAILGRAGYKRTFSPVKTQDSGIFFFVPFWKHKTLDFFPRRFSGIPTRPGDPT